MKPQYNTLMKPIYDPKNILLENVMKDFNKDIEEVQYKGR